MNYNFTPSPPSCGGSSNDTNENQRSSRDRRDNLADRHSSGGTLETELFSLVANGLDLSMLLPSTAESTRIIDQDDDRLLYSAVDVETTRRMSTDHGRWHTDDEETSPNLLYSSSSTPRHTWEDTMVSDIDGGSSSGGETMRSTLFEILCEVEEMMVDDGWHGMHPTADRDADADADADTSNASPRRSH